MIIVINALFNNNIAVLLVEETGVSGQNYQPAASR